MFLLGGRETLVKAAQNRGVGGQSECAPINTAISQRPHRSAEMGQDSGINQNSTNDLIKMEEHLSFCSIVVGSFGTLENKRMNPSAGNCAK